MKKKLIFAAAGMLIVTLVLVGGAYGMGQKAPNLPPGFHIQENGCWQATAHNGDAIVSCRGDR